MPVRGERRVEFSARVQGCPQGGAIQSNPWARCYGALQDFRSYLIGSSLIGNHAKAVKALRVTRIFLQSL